MPTNICGQLVPSCVSIDHTNNKALNNSRLALPLAREHSSTSTAVGNSQSCLQVRTPPPSIMFVGHGFEGVIVTGTGDVADDRDRRISFKDTDWRPLLRSLRNQISELIFCACDTGKGNNGARLLQDVADETGARVTAFTGFIYATDAGGFTCDPDGEWIHRDPQPQPDRFMAFTPLAPEARMNIKLMFDDTFVNVPLRESSSLSFFDSDSERLTASLQGADAIQFASLIKFSEPMKFEGVPLAVVTGRIKLRAGDENSAVERSFTIYNDRVLQDQTVPENFYRGTSALADALSNFRNRT